MSSPAVARGLIQPVGCAPITDPHGHVAALFDHDSSAGGALSKRERDVLALIADGLTNRQIARELHLSVRTIEAQRASIKVKLGDNSYPNSGASGGSTTVGGVTTSTRKASVNALDKLFA